MDGLFLEPWILPPEPPLARLALEAADEGGIAECGAWPEWRKGGVGFGELPPFLTWHGVEGGRHQLVLIQPREVGARVPGARIRPLPEAWLEALDLAALARPLARHPAFPGGTAVHVVSIAGAGGARVRSWGKGGDRVVRGVLEAVTGVGDWDLGEFGGKRRP